MRIRSFSSIGSLSGLRRGSGAPFLRFSDGARRLQLLKRTGFGTVLCAGALIAGPMAFGPLVAQVQAAPTIGGDENGPQVQILQPAYQDVLKNNAGILVAIKTRNFSPETLEIFFDGKPDSSGLIRISKEAAASTSFSWNTKMFADGPHKLMVRVTDAQGFRGWAEVNVFINNGKKIDLTPPSLGWANVQPFQQLSGLAEVQLQATDNFGVKWIIFTVNSASEPNRKPALKSWLINRPPYAIKFDTTSVADGLYQLSARAWDSFDQEGTAPPLTIGVVNRGGINATTIGEMLSTMKKQAPVTTAAPPVPIAREVAPNAPRTAKMIPPAPTKVAPTPKLQVAPSSPRIVERAVGKTPKIAAAPAKPTAPSPFESSVATALNPVAPANPRVAVGPSAFSGNAMLSSALGLEMSQIGRRELLPDASQSSQFTSERIAAPGGTARAVPGGPTLSQNDSKNGERLAAAIPSRVEALSALAPSRLSTPDTLVARAVAEPAQPTTRAIPAPSDAMPMASMPSMPSFSMPSLSNRPRLADRVLPDTSSDAKTSSEFRVAAPTLSGERVVPMSPNATMSQSVSSSQPKIAEPKIAGRGLLAPFTLPSAPASTREGKASSPDRPRLAALPRREKPGAAREFSAITVSPLEVKTSDAIPAFHHVTRSTDLRAVAARYGLPVAVVAACNNWPSEMQIVAGTNVKLPQQLKIAYQGVPVHADAPSLLVGGTGVTAFRFLFEQQGGKMQWDAKNQRVIARKGKSEVVLKIGSAKAKVGDKDVMMELAAFLFEGRTMVPVRFFEQGLHAQVEWDPQTGRIVVAMAG